MQIKEFRGDEFINRENEINFIKNWVGKIPKEILWIYGPKSTGKTTLIEYIIERELIKDFKLFSKSNYWIKYINFRGKLVGSYESFLNSFLMRENNLKEELDVKISLGIIGINYKLFEKVQNKEMDLFDVVISELDKIKKQKIIVIDEIQTLEDIYYNGEKELLKEFLNFCVRLTKELHLCHVIILSSNTVFIDRIYNDAKLKVTSRFYKIDHLDKETTLKYLEYKIRNSEFNIQNSKLDMIWDYLGGCIPLLQRMIREYEEYPSIEDYLSNQVNLALSEIIMFLEKGKNITDEDEELFIDIIKEILKDGHFALFNKKRKKYIQTIEKFAQVEILFFDPLTLIVTGNNRLYEKAFEELIK